MCQVRNNKLEVLVIIMPEPDSLDCQQNILPKCPHCGHDHEDYFEFDKDGTYTCEECGKQFELEVETVLMFNTRKV
jgi:transcription elongation factor Elf1